MGFSTMTALPAESAAPEHGLLPITAPMVGKFYAALSPSDPPFVMPGTKVALGATVGLIEVMKTFTPVLAEEGGRLVRFLVENDDIGNEWLVGAKEVLGKAGVKIVAEEK